MRTTFALFAAATLLAAPAAAADLPRGKAPMAPFSPVSVFNWTGFYAGVHGGYAWKDADGWFGGGQIGFNSQAPGSPLVWGVELDSAAANIGESANILGITVSSKTNYFGTLRGRVGVAADRTLFYGTGGLAWARNKISIGGISDTKTHTGWTVGAGIEQDFGGGWSGKVEYLYADFGSKTYFGAFNSGRQDVHTVKVGMNYRFGAY